ncbi:FabG-like 3-oxoacyl-(acyl-carrier-protein) reductase [Paraconexibacter sp. AEG42_29]|uniref:FabG-like 3-oxoacyl-(Acyl-carrier-protein) reductase n=1 Tax=Paraconexibacter sp. AEG42_29 TaxID=2997339 RepID=A0AAU7B024_9ACTN
MSVAGRALVTGASSGIGREIARVLAARGYALVVTARRRQRLDELAAELRAAHGVDVDVVTSDLSSPDGATALHDAVAGMGLEIDVLVNNAGHGDPTWYHASPWEAHAHTIQLMAVSPARLIHLFVPGMVERGRGHVVSVCSVAALTPGLPLHGCYSPTKAFMLRLTQTLAVDYAGTGVTFSATIPGFTESELLDSSGARGLTNRLPRFMVAGVGRVAEETVDACLNGTVVYTHTWWNRISSALIKQLPIRYAHRTMGLERERVRKDLPPQEPLTRSPSRRRSA